MSHPRRPHALRFCCRTSPAGQRWTSTKKSERRMMLGFYPPEFIFILFFFTALGVRRKRKSNLWIKKNPFGCSSQEPTDHLGCSRPPWHNHSHLSKIWAPAPARYSGSAPFRLHFFMLAIEPRRTFYHKRPSTEKVLTLNLVCTGFNFFADDNSTRICVIKRGQTSIWSGG